MKTFTLLLLTFLFLQLNSFTQDFSFQDSKDHTDAIIALNGNQISSPLDSALSAEIIYRYERARKMNIAGIAMGSTANLTLIINSKSLVRNAWEDPNIIIGVFGEVSAAIRLVFSGATVHQLNLVQKELDKLRLITGNESKYDQSYKSFKTAKNLVVAVPILGAAGLGLMIAYVYADLMNDKTSAAFLSAGWALAASGLVTSVVSQFYIVKAKKIFQNESGFMDIGMSKHGLGVEVSYLKIGAVSIEMAQMLKFQGSPTILVDDIDLCTGIKPDGFNYSCRVYEFERPE